jgi:phosphonate degradation associated HDIG domain protein
MRSCGIDVAPNIIENTNKSKLIINFLNFIFMTTKLPLAPLIGIYREKGSRRYGLTGVTQLEHALQGARLAEQDGCPPHLIVATLLHDVGHMVHDLGEAPAAVGLDDLHQRLGADYLVQWFGGDVTQPVRMHVAAKRYLCHAEAGYLENLSDDSMRSLQLQGGPMSPEEAVRFRGIEGFGDAVQLRLYDDRAKTAGLQTPGIEHFLGYMAQCAGPC